MNNSIARKARNYAFVLLFLLGQSLWSQSPAQTQLLKQKEDSLISKLNKGQHDTSKLVTLLSLIALYQDVQPQKITPWINEGIRIASANKNDDKLLAFYVANIRVSNRLGRFTDALAAAEKVEYLLKKEVQPNTAGAFFMQKGASLYKMGAYDKAAKEFNNVVELGRKQNLPAMEVKAIMNLAILYDALQRYEDMRSQLTEALKIAEKANLKEDKANIIFNLSFLESRTNNYGKAIDYLLEVLPYYQETGNLVVVAHCYANLSWAYYQVKRYAEALETAQKSYLIRAEQNDRAGLAKIHINLGQIYLETGNYDSSINHLNKGLELAKQVKTVQTLKDGYKTLASVYARQKRYKEAYENLLFHNEWKDSTYQVDKDKQLLQQLNMYKFHYGDSVLVVKDGIIQKQATTNKTLWIVPSILLVAVSFLCLLLFRILKEKGKLLAEQMTNTPLVSSSIEASVPTEAYDMLLAERNKLVDMVSDLKAGIEVLETNLKNQTGEDLERLRALVGSSKLQTEGYWNEFLLLFSNVYPLFFEKLKTKFPQLTQNELRMCALMKLNLSLLETSNVLNITAESVRKARYRLYKKIDLGSDQELVELMIIL